MKRHGQLLRPALRVNALFSAISGATLLVLPAWWAGLLGVLDAPAYGLLGAALLIFAALVAWASADVENRRAIVRLVIAADLLWVAATPVVMLLGAGAITRVGQLLLAAVCALVALLAAAQWRGLRGLHASMGG